MKGKNNGLRRHHEFSQMDELQWIAYRRRETRKEMKMVGKEMRLAYEGLTKKEKIPSDKWGKTAYLLSKSGTILNGVRLGIKVGRAVNTLVKLKRLFSGSKR